MWDGFIAQFAIGITSEVISVFAVLFLARMGRYYFFEAHRDG